MKRVLFVLMGVICITVNAQTYVKLGVRGGVGLTTTNDNVTITDENGANQITPDVGLGYYVGPSLEVMFNNIGFETAVLYSERNLKYKYDTDNSSIENTDITVSSSHIEIPLNIRGTVRTSKNSKFYMMAGPYIGFRISGQNSFNDTKDNIKNSWKAKTFSAGLNLGTGIELFKSWRIGLNYNWGLTNNYKESDSSYGVKSRQISITTGLYF